MRTADDAEQLWGIYHLDPDQARRLGNPLRTVIQAPSKLAAEETAARLGFGEATARPIHPEDVERAQWLSHDRPGHRQERARSKRKGVRL